MVSRGVTMLVPSKWIGRTVRSGSNGPNAQIVRTDRTDRTDQIGLGVTKSLSTITHGNSGGAESLSAPPLYCS